MNRDCISSEREHDMQKHEKKKIHKCKWRFGGTAGLEELHITAPTSSLLHGKPRWSCIDFWKKEKLDVSFLLFWGSHFFIYFCPWLSCLLAYVNLAVVVQNKLAGICIMLAKKKNNKKKKQKEILELIMLLSYLAVF